MTNAETISTHNLDDKSLNTFEIKKIDNTNNNISYNYNMEISNILPKEIKFMDGYYNSKNKKFILPTKLETQNEHHDGVSVRLKLCTDKKEYEKLHVINLSENIIVLDFDNHNNNGLSYEKIIDKYPYLEDCVYTNGKNDKGFHFYIHNEKYSKYSKQTNVNNNGFDLDFISDVIHEKYRVKIKGTKIINLSNYQIEELYPNIVNKQVKGFISEKTNNDILKKIENISDEKFKAFLFNLNENYFDSYENWRLTLNVCKNCNKKELFREFSKLGNYSEYEFEENWENADFKNINFNWILKHSKMCNLKIHKELIKKYVYNDFYITSDVADSLQELSELVLPYLFKVLKYCNKKWISFNESTNLWTIDADPSKNIIDIINIGLSANIKYLTYKINSVDQANQSDFANKLKYIIAYKKRKDSSGYITSFKNYIHTMLEDNEFYLKLDSSKFKWFFENGMLDLKTNEFREGIFYSDYVTKVLPYDYKPDIDIEKLDYVKQQFKKVCNNNQEHLDYYLSTIAYSLCNAPDEVKAFWIFVGELADNGKTKPLEALTKIFPCYIKKGNAQLIYESKSSKKHKFMGNISYRLLWIDELSRTEKLDTAFLKELADGGDVNNEVMYGTESIIKNNCKLIVPSNWLPNFETDEGMKSRLKCMQFNSKFKQNTTIDNYEELDFVRDCNLMDKIVDCKHEVISLLREYVFSYINNNLPTMPSEFQETTNTTYELNDEFNAWIEDNCVIDLSFKLAKQDIFKYSDFDKKDLFSNMKRLGFKYNKNGCINGKRGYFIGLKMKEDDCEME